jgi:hypothetical protein
VHCSRSAGDHREDVVRPVGGRWAQVTVGDGGEPAIVTPTSSTRPEERPISPWLPWLAALWWRSRDPPHLSAFDSGGQSRKASRRARPPARPSYGEDDRKSF